MTILRFDMQTVMPIYERVMAADEICPTYEQTLDGHTSDLPKALWLVKDHGVYLMSAAKDRDPAEGCVYAQGHDPEQDEDWYDRGHDLSGDDFVEAIPWTWVAAAEAADQRMLCIEITPENVRLVFEH